MSINVIDGLMRFRKKTNKLNEREKNARERINSEFNIDGFEKFVRYVTECSLIENTFV